MNYYPNMNVPSSPNGYTLYVDGVPTLNINNTSLQMSHYPNYIGNGVPMARIYHNDSIIGNVASGYNYGCSNYNTSSYCNTNGFQSPSMLAFNGNTNHYQNTGLTGTCPVGPLWTGTFSNRR